MSDKHLHKTPDISGLKTADICGLWEVIKIYRENDNSKSYPWLAGRFRYNFMCEMVFLCTQNGKSFHGDWELSEKVSRTGKEYAIILNGSLKYTILDLNEDEMLLSYLGYRYHLVKRL